MKKFTRVELEQVNVTELEAQAKANRLADVYGGLIRLFAEVLDMAAAGDNTWVSVGKTQDGSALALTVHSPDGKLSAYAGTFGGLATEAAKLL